MLQISELKSLINSELDIRYLLFFRLSNTKKDKKYYKDFSTKQNKGLFIKVKILRLISF